MSPHGPVDMLEYRRRARAIAAAAVDAVPAAVLEAIRSAQRVWIVPHERPDADALGAALGLREIVRRQGGNAEVLSADAAPSVYDVIPMISEISLEPPAWQPDTVVLVDCADAQRTGRMTEVVDSLPPSTNRIIIDHHVSNSSDWPLSWIAPEAAATCELITLLAVALDVDLSADGGTLATALAAGLIMDTANFQHGNTTPRALEVGGLLLAAGAPLSEVSRRIYRSKPLAQIRLHAQVLSRIMSSDSGSTVVATMTQGDLVTAGATAEMSEGIVDTLAQVAEADVAIFVKVDEGSSCRVSVRTKGEGPNATDVVAPFGGGGHARAAGASIARPLAEAVALVTAHVTELRARTVSS